MPYSDKNLTLLMKNRTIGPYETSLHYFSYCSILPNNLGKLRRHASPNDSHTITRRWQALQIFCHCPLVIKLASPSIDVTVMIQELRTSDANAFSWHHVANWQIFFENPLCFWFLWFISTKLAVKCDVFTTLKIL